MNRFRGVVLIVALVAFLDGCGGGHSTQLSAPAPLPSASQTGGTYVSAHFVFEYNGVDAANIALTAQRVESQYARVLTDLRADSMPLVRVTFYLDHAAMEAATLPIAGVVPAWASGLVTGEDHIHMMSPFVSGWGSYDDMVVRLVHEFVHCVSMHLNTAIANRPRWFWEAVAIYEAGQYVDPHSLPYMIAHQPPTLAQLSDMSDTRIYEVGYLIGEFVVSQWGLPSFHDLIRNNCDTQATLGISSEEFEREWFAFASQKHSL